VDSYINKLRKNPKDAKKVLLNIDAEIIKFYALPPCLEHALLTSFWGVQRPVPFEFKGYVSPDVKSWIPLHIRLSSMFNEGTPNQIMTKIPLIKDETFINFLENLGMEE
jgi:hypothetical protein